MNADRKGFVVNNINNAYELIGVTMPFELHKAILTDKTGKTEVYVLAMRGTNSSFHKNDPLSIPVCLLAALNKPNLYFNLVKETILKYVPNGAKLVFLGHSLGGMIAQMVAADALINSKYTVLNVLCIGSPYVLGACKGLRVHRMLERADAIPHLFGLSVLHNCFGGDAKKEAAGYWGRVIAAHTDSYLYGKVWQKYDCYGLVNGGHELEIISKIY